jgi:ABC-type Fe3+/spermidine/putrescine transport system ATPase subunit
VDDRYVELVRLSKRFGAIEAVSDVSLAVLEGRIMTLLGPSGCGKTTLLRLIAGFIQPDDGEIRIKGRRVNEVPPQRRSTVVVFQDYALFPHLSVFENVAYGLRRRGAKGAEVNRRVLDMLEFLGLTGQHSVSPLELSGGQQQRVALARALVVEPDVLLLDEPLSNLDAKLRARVRTELKEIQQALGKTTILVTHDQEEALSISDRIAVMASGRIRQTGTPLDVYARPVDQFVADFVGIANLVPATVRSVTPGRIMLESPIGQLTTGNAIALIVGQSVTVVLRPTALRVWAMPAVGRVRATVRSTSFLGELRRYYMQVGELRLVVDQPLVGPDEMQADLWLTVDETREHHILPITTS